MRWRCRQNEGKRSDDTEHALAPLKPRGTRALRPSASLSRAGPPGAPCARSTRVAAPMRALHAPRLSTIQNTDPPIRPVHAAIHVLTLPEGIGRGTPTALATILLPQTRQRATTLRRCSRAACTALLLPHARRHRSSPPLEWPAAPEIQRRPSLSDPPPGGGWPAPADPPPSTSETCSSGTKLNLSKGPEISGRF